MTSAQSYNPKHGAHLFEARRTVRDAIEGKLQLLAQGEMYLPRLESQTDVEFDRYRKRGKYFNIIKQTRTTMVGTVMSKPAVIKLPPRQAAMERTAGIKGEPLMNVVEEALEEAITVGQIGLLLVRPKGDVNVQPRIATIKVEDLEDWKTDWRDGVQVLSELTVMDGPQYIDTVRGERDMHMRYWLNDEDEGRVWWQRFYYEAKERQTVDSGRFDVGAFPLKTIPFIFCSYNGVTPKTVQPPMYDLADLCIQIWRTSVEKNNTLFRAGFPQIAVSGSISDSETPQNSGPGFMHIFPSGTQVTMLELTGASAAAMEAEIQSGIRQAYQMGASMQGVGGMNGTASTNRDVATMRMRGELSLLHQAVENVERAFRQLIEWAIIWDNGTTSGGTVSMPDFEFTLNREWIEEGLAPAMLKELKEMVGLGYLSPRALYLNIQRMGLTIPEHDFDMDQGLIEHDTPLEGHQAGGHDPIE